MKIIALIPARSGSKRVRHKNIQPLGGVPLLVWSIQLAKTLDNIDAFVSTDSEQYAEIARSADAQVLMRPPEICTDQATDQDVIFHAIEQVHCDLVVYLRPTTPFRQVEVVAEAIKIMSDAGPEITGLRSVEEMEESYFKAFRIDREGLLIGTVYADKPNQYCPKTYRANGYIDIARAEVVKQGQLWGPSVYGYITPRVIEIDTEEDLRYAGYWLGSRRLSAQGRA